MYRTEIWTLWEKARVGCFERTALKHVYFLGWNRSPAQAGCMIQVLGPGALGRPRGIRWTGRWEGGSGWEIHVNPWLIHVNVWQKPLQYCKVISLQLIKKNGRKKKTEKERQAGRGDNKQHKTYWLLSGSASLPPWALSVRLCILHQGSPSQLHLRTWVSPGSSDKATAWGRSTRQP